MPHGRSSKAINGALWMLSGSGIAQIIYFAINIALARILVPEDFAAVALIISVLAVANTFTEMGLSVAVVQRKEVSPEILDSAITLTVCFFGGISLAICLFATPLVNYYGMPVLAPLTRMAAIAFFFQGLNSFFRSLLLRETRFQALSVIEIVAISINGATAITSAFLGYGARSIVLGQICGNIAGFLVLIIIKPYIPKTLGKISLMRDLLSFGVWVSIGRILGTASGQFDKFFIGKVLEPKILGGYHIASRLTMSVPSLFTGIIDQVLLPIYSSSKNDPEVIERGYWKGLRYSTILIVPMSVFIAVFARQLVVLLLGIKWLYIVPIIQIVSISSIFQGMGGGIFASAIFSSGKPQLNVIVNIFRIITLPVCIWIGSIWGIIGIAWGVAAFGVVGRLFNQWLLQVYLGYSLRQYFQVIALPVLVNVGMLIFGVLCQSFVNSSSYIIIAVGTGFFGLLMFGLYGLLCWRLMPEESDFLFNHFYAQWKRLKHK